VENDTRPHLVVRTTEELDAWLSEHGSTSAGVWLVRFKSGSGEPVVAWSDVVDVLLCHGWIDSAPRKLDAARSLLLITPRRPDSAWSAVNRAKVLRLVETGRMRPAGERAIAVAKERGAWSRLEVVDNLEIPVDLGVALDGLPEARANFERFPPSSRRGILEWIALAKRPETRAARVLETAEKASRNIKANHPVGRDRGPRK
jgi:uncharacterized protein YdeI (YjbR/CyaY-like superfamily)